MIETLLTEAVANLSDQTLTWAQGKAKEVKDDELQILHLAYLLLAQGAGFYITHVPEMDPGIKTHLLENLTKLHQVCTPGGSPISAEDLEKLLNDGLVPVNPSFIHMNGAQQNEGRGVMEIKSLGPYLLTAAQVPFKNPDNAARRALMKAELRRRIKLLRLNLNKLPDVPEDIPEDNESD